MVLEYVQAKTFKEALEQLCFLFSGYRALGHQSWIKILKAIKTYLLSEAQIPDLLHVSFTLLVEPGLYSWR